jgi:hypothetical protein
MNRSYLLRRKVPRIITTIDARTRGAGRPLGPGRAEGLRFRRLAPLKQDACIAGKGGGSLGQYVWPDRLDDRPGAVACALGVFSAIESGRR